MNFNEAMQMLGNKLQGKYGHLGFKYKKSDKTLTRHSKNFTYMIAFSSFGGNTKDSISIEVCYIINTRPYDPYGYAKPDLNTQPLFYSLRDNEIYLDIGNEEKIKRRRLEFVADTGYTLENIEKTDYIFCPSALLFSKRFVEKIGNLLREEMKFFSCRLVCQDVSLEWYAAKIILRIPIIDKEASTYRTLSDGERVLSFIKFRRDIEEEFFIAKDKESITDFVVSELFVDI